MSDINTLNLVDNFVSESVTKSLDGVEPQLSSDNTLDKVVSFETKNTTVSFVPALDLEKYLLFEMNEDVKKLVISLTNNKQCVNDILHIVELIMADGKIDVSDAPLLISFFKKIVTLRFDTVNISKNMSPGKYITSIKYVLLILTKENIINIPNQEAFVSDISKLLDRMRLAEEVGNSIKKYFSCFQK
jgi:hypothetical protein